MPCEWPFSCTQLLEFVDYYNYFIGNEPNDLLYTEGANYEGWLTHAKQDNEPIGLHSKHDEISQAVCPLGLVAKDRLQVPQTITISNQALPAGKRLGGEIRAAHTVERHDHKIAAKHERDTGGISPSGAVLRQ